MKNFFKKYFLFIILTIQPLLDVFAYFSMGTSLDIIPFAIRSLILLIFTMYILKKEFHNKKYWIFLIAIFSLFLLHVASSYINGYINFYKDLNAFIRYSYMPIFAVNFYYCIKDNPLRIEQLKKGIVANVIMIFCIILINICCGNIVHTYAEGVGLRGWFYNSNSQSLILGVCVPYSIYYICFEKKYNIIIRTISYIIGFFLLYSNGTTTTYIMLIFTFLLTSYFYLVDKNVKFNKLINVFLTSFFLILSLIFYNYSPNKKINDIEKKSYGMTSESFESFKNNDDVDFNNMTSHKDETKENNDIFNKNDTINNNESSNKNNMIKNNESSNKNNMIKNNESSNEIALSIETRKKHSIIDYYFDKSFIKDYGYDKILNVIGEDFDYQHFVDNRYRKRLVAEVIFRDSNIFTKMFGFEFTQIKQYDTDLENDISSIYYYYGYIGFVLFISFIFYVLFTGIKCFILNPKIILESQFVILYALFCILILVSEFSGSMLNRPNASIYMSVFAALILSMYAKKGKSK